MNSSTRRVLDALLAEVLRRPCPERTPSGAARAEIDCVSVMIDDPFGKPCLHLTSTDGEITQALQWDGGRFTLATTIAHDLIRPSTLEVTHFRGPDNIVYEGPHAPCHRSILFNPTEFFVVQTRPHTSQAHAE